MRMGILDGSSDVYSTFLKAVELGPKPDMYGAIDGCRSIPKSDKNITDAAKSGQDSTSLLKVRYSRVQPHDYKDMPAADFANVFKT